MSEFCVIEKKICVRPEFLGKNLRKKVLEDIQNITKNECSKETGYILNVLKLKKIKNNIISSNNCEIILEIDVLAEILKPEINKFFEDKVCMIFSGGIFLDIKGKFKVLIPQNSLDNFTFDSKNKSFRRDKMEINESDIVKVKITGLKYANKNFSCIGELVI